MRYIIPHASPKIAVQIVYEMTWQIVYDFNSARGDGERAHSLASAKTAVHLGTYGATTDI